MRRCGRTLPPVLILHPLCLQMGVILRVAYAWVRRCAVRLMEDPRQLQGSKSECTLADMITRGTFASSCMHLYVPAHIFGVGLEMCSLAAHVRAHKPVLPSSLPSIDLALASRDHQV